MDNASTSAIGGACNCGKITIEVDENAFPKESSLCHCLNCKTSSSGLATSNLKIAADAVKVHGTPKVYMEKETGSGTPMERNFCGDCGSPILSKSQLMPQLAFVKSGLFYKAFAKEGKSIPAPL